MNIKENMSWYRNVIHWLLSPLTLLLYSIISFYAITVFIWNGKKFARHDMAGKDGLSANTAILATNNNEKQEFEVKTIQSKRRSTSTSKDYNNMNHKSKDVLCVLPQKFYFGEFYETMEQIDQKILLKRI